MGNEDAGDVYFIVEEPEPAPQFLPHPGIQGPKGFVQEQHPGLDGQGPGQGDPLFLPPAQLRGKAVCQGLKLHQGEEAEHPVPDLRLGGPQGPGPYPEAKGDVFKNAHVLEQGVVLEHETHLPVPDLFIRGILPEEAHGPLVRAFKPRDDPQQGGLPGTRGPQEGGDLTAGDAEIHVIQGGKGAELFADVGDLYAHVSFP